MTNCDIFVALTVQFAAFLIDAYSTSPKEWVKSESNVDINNLGDLSAVTFIAFLCDIADIAPIFHAIYVVVDHWKNGTSHPKVRIGVGALVGSSFSVFLTLLEDVVFYVQSSLTNQNLQFTSLFWMWNVGMIPQLITCGVSLTLREELENEKRGLPRYHHR